MIERLNKLSEQELRLLRSLITSVALDDIEQYIIIYDLRNEEYTPDTHPSKDPLAVEELINGSDMFALALTISQYRKNKYGID